MAEAPLTLAALRQQRELTIARLCQHFALDHLEAEELEQRIDRAHRAASPAELDALLEGLPALESAPAGPPAVAGPAGSAGEHQLVLAVMGGVERRGGWTPARNVYVTAVMGGALLDFRHARLAPGITEVYVLAIMGGVEIVVPPGVHLESNGIGIMGGFEHAGDGRFPVDSGVPVLRVTGAAVMGGVEVKVRAAGALAPGERRPRDAEETSGPADGPEDGGRP